ncbi:MAG: metallophosphoesterase [Acutalibacteraceae bacterium]
MRITVISDSHRNKSTVERILSSQPQSHHVFFLGDVTADIEDMQALFPDKSFYIVSGNCDYFSLYPSSGIETVGGKKIFYTHGHTLGVKHGLENLIKTAKASGCDIALYGHTHTSQILYEDGIYVVNPGSCAQPRDSRKSYAVIDIEKNGIMPIINLC